jgi:hypothetical protein
MCGIVGLSLALFKDSQPRRISPYEAFVSDSSVKLFLLTLILEARWPQESTIVKSVAKNLGGSKNQMSFTTQMGRPK